MLCFSRIVCGSRMRSPRSGISDSGSLEENKAEFETKIVAEQTMEPIKEKLTEQDRRILQLRYSRCVEKLIRYIGFSSDFYIEPKPKEPMKYQYHFDVVMMALETVTNQYLGGDAILACSTQTQTKVISCTACEAA